jgi:hypothetical protein
MSIIVSPAELSPLATDHRVVDTAIRKDRYAGPVRATGSVVAGIVAGALLLGSSLVGIGYAVEGHNPQDWNVALWGDHWVWRAIASATATYCAGFLTGMIARRRGGRAAVIASIPSALFWLFIAYAGWTARVPFGGPVEPIPLGYRIIATILVFATLPLAANGGQAGAPYGRANGEHYDSRRATLLGVRWYHFVWLPMLLHLMVLTAAFGAAYGSQWLVAAWKAGVSIFAFVPMLFYFGLLITLGWLGSGAMKTYEALAGFEDDSGLAVWKRVMKYGFGYTIGVALVQFAIGLTHYGLSRLMQRLFG